MSRTIAIIPARGGSKGIPRKNVLPFHGKPLIWWSIHQAMKTPEIDTVYVSSDNAEILDLATQYGAKTIVRPDEIAGDKATSESAMVHALGVVGQDVGLVLMLQPTSPLRKPDDMSRAIQQFRSEGWDSGFSGAVLEDFLIWEKTADNTYRSMNYDYLNRGRRQDRKPQYVENGSIYLFKPEIMLTQNNRMGGKIGIAIQEFWQSFEIDNSEDWGFVESLFSQHLEKLYKNNK